MLDIQNYSKWSSCLNNAISLDSYPRSNSKLQSLINELISTGEYSSEFQGDFSSGMKLSERKLFSEFPSSFLWWSLCSIRLLLCSISWLSIE